MEKFFSTTESAVLFPEFIRRMVQSGVEQSVLSDVMAVHTKVDASEYVGGVLTDDTDYSTTTTDGAALPTATYLESSSILTLDKYGRAVHASYEAVRRQKLDTFGSILRAIGVRLSNTILVKATEKMIENAGSTIAAETSGSISYTDLTNLYGAFQDFDMTALLASPSAAAVIMALDQMQEMASTQPNVITLPFGAQLRKCASMDTGYLVGLDTQFAMEMVTSGDLILETDKLIDNQLDVITMSLHVGFRVMTADAIHILSL